MGLAIRTEYLKRYKDIARLLIKYGWADVAAKTGLVELVEKPEEEVKGKGDAESEGNELAADLERMGPTFVKLGQLLSTRPDIMPMKYIKPLSRLQDRVGSFPYEQVEKIIERELGKKVSEAYARFDETPIAAASLGQVHRGVLPDGTDVAVKVQRPGIREGIMQDLEVLGDISYFIDRHTQFGDTYRLGEILDEFRNSVMSELDYKQEAWNMSKMRENLREYDRLYVAAPIYSHSTSKALTMEYVVGSKISELSELQRRDLDAGELVEQAFTAYLQQILVDGFFHADPHPGNVFLTPDRKLALLDLGMVARMARSLQERLLKLLLAISEGHPEDAAMIAMSMGEKTEYFDERNYNRRAVDLISRYQDASVDQLEVGMLVLEICQIAGESGMRVRTELTMLGKTLLNMDEVGRILDPNFDPNACVRRNAVELFSKQISKNLSSARILRSALELKDILERMPKALNSVLDQIANNRLQVKVDTINELRLIEGIQKVANRITMGILLASLVVGAAILARIPTKFTLLGYPGLAIILFLLAAAGSIGLVLDIFITDERRRRRF
jgi:predicted unusual protein kinase regulating ubiquinone biosynthesis (AarF/ABC1/UbiB family)